MFRLRGWAVTPPSKSECCAFNPHCGQSGGWLGTRVCAPAPTDKKASNPARRHALTRIFHFERTRFILYHLVLECFETWPGTGEWFQKAAEHPLQMKCARLVVQALLLGHQPACATAPGD